MKSMVRAAGVEPSALLRTFFSSPHRECGAHYYTIGEGQQVRSDVSVRASVPILFSPLLDIEHGTLVSWI